MGIATDEQVGARQAGPGRLIGLGMRRKHIDPAATSPGIALHREFQAFDDAGYRASGFVHACKFCADRLIEVRCRRRVGGGRYGCSERDQDRR